MGEDPLASMGYVPAAPEARDAPRRRRRRGPRRGPGRARTLVSLAVLVGFLGVTGAVVVPFVVDAVQSIDDQLDDPSFLPKGEDEPDRTPPVGLQRESLVLRGNLVPALRRLEARSGDGRVRLLRIAPDRIDAQVITAEGRMRNIQHRFTGETQVLSDTALPGAATRGTFAWSAVEPSAPRRIVERALRGKSKRELEYLVLLDAAGLRWSAHLSGGDAFTARPDGRGVRRIGS